MAEPRVYFEQPDRPLYCGEVMQLQNTTESALEIGMWLAENGIQSWVLPKGKDSPLVGAMLMITGLSQSDRRGGIVFPEEYVMVCVDTDRADRKYAVVINPGEFFRKYSTEPTSLPLHR